MISRPLTAVDVQIYRLCEDLTTVLVYFMVVFGPWAFGTTQSWSTWTMNTAGFLLGLLLMAKLFIRQVKGFPAARWGAAPRNREGERSIWHLSPIRALIVLTVVLLAFTFTSAINARATYYPDQLNPEYHDSIKWLPHSLDSARTWLWSWNYLALALAFWAAYDWMLGKTEREIRAHPPRHELMPERLRKLLWLLAINGGLLALEGIIQRLEGSGYLLFMIKPRVNPGAEAQFGPWAYRGSAASYFNLLWPVCLGFWWTLHRYADERRRRLPLLLICTALMAASPFVSTSRGGAIVGALQMGLSALFLIFSQFLLAGPKPKSSHIRTSVLLLVFCFAALGAGFLWGWKRLEPRIAELREGYLLREKMFDSARPMARDYPIFGTGPGTFATVFQLYRISTDTYWPAQLHNDWLETRITFGWLGSTLIGMAMAAVLWRWFTPGGIYGGRRFVGLIWIALAGCLLHARWDFPFQIYSVLFLWIILCAMLCTVSRRPG